MTSIAPLSRRSFLKTTASGLAASGLAAAPFVAGAGRARGQSRYISRPGRPRSIPSKAISPRSKPRRGSRLSTATPRGRNIAKAMITKFVGGAPIDMLWVSDSWLPEWAEAGWIAPIDQYKDLTEYNADVEQFCVDSMSYKGKQYGITYYTTSWRSSTTTTCCAKAGISAPPTELGRRESNRPRSIKAKGLSEYPDPDRRWRRRPGSSSS